MKSECPDAELLVTYLVARLDDPQRVRLDAHLLECDHCTAAMTVMHQRWRMADRIAVPVPAAVAAAADEAPALAGSGRQQLWRTVRERLVLLTRLPVLMPAAFAFGAILMLVVQQVSWQPSGPLMRAVPLDQMLHIRTVVRVYAEPDPHAAILTALPAGTVVDMRAQTEGWYRITLPDGREGWVEQAGVE